MDEELIKYYIKNKIKVNKEFINKIINEDIDIKICNNKINNKILGNYDFINNTVEIYDNNINNKINYLNKNYSNNFVFGFLYYLSVILHEKEHINQYNYKEKDYLQLIYRKFYELEKKNFEKTKSVFKKNYSKYHDDFIVEKMADYISNKEIIDFDQKNNLLNENQKIFFYNNFLLSLLNGYKLSFNNKIISAAEINMKLMKLKINLDDYNYDYKLDKKMASGLPISIDEYNMVENIFFSQTLDEIKKIKKM